MTPNLRRTLLAVSIALAATAAAADDETAFGDSVRNMIQQQIYNPQAASNPPREPPAALDGRVVDRAFADYRNSGPRWGVQPAESMDLPVAVQQPAGPQP